MFATDIVVAQYVNATRIGERLVEFEFIVTEKLIGNAEERIFVYTDAGVELIGSSNNLTSGTDYLLILMRMTPSPYSINTREGGFGFVNEVIIDLNNISIDTLHRLDLSNGVTKEQIISHVVGLAAPTMYQEVGWDVVFIQSEDIEDIIIGSPYVLLVEIAEPRRLVNEQITTDWMSTDIYYVEVIEVLEGTGNIVDGETIRAIFFADTVFTGEQHIVALTRRERGSNNYTFTSRNSLFPMEDLPEILAILNPPQSVTITAEGTGDRLLPGNTLQLSATVYPSVARQNITWSVAGHPQATISETGLLAVANTTPGGTVLTVTATATNTEVYATLDVTITLPEDEDGFRWFAGGHHRSGANNESDDETNDTTTEQEHRLQLIFTINETIFLLNGDHRTAVGAPFLEGARTMVPLRTIAESTGAGVEWCDDTQAAIIHLYRSPLYAPGVHQPTLTIPISAPLPDGMGSVMLINARTFVPLRFIMEAMDADVEWLEETEQAIITWLATCQGS